MDFRREAAGLPGLRDAVLRSSYWDAQISVEWIQLALNIKAVMIINLGNGKYEIIYDELPDGVFDFDPDSFVVLRRDWSHYELMEDGPGEKAFRYSAPPVEIRERLVGKGFFASIAYAPRILAEASPTPPEPDILTEADPLAGENPTPKDSACPTPNQPDSVENGHVIGMTGEGNIAIYLSDCAFAPKSGGVTVSASVLNKLPGIALIPREYSYLPR